MKAYNLIRWCVRLFKFEVTWVNNRSLSENSSITDERQIIDFHESPTFPLW